MNQDIERLLNAPPDSFERTLFLAERELELVESMAAITARVSAALDATLDAVLTVAANDADDDGPAELAEVRAKVAALRACRPTIIEEPLARLFSHVHAMHKRYKERTP